MSENLFGETSGDETAQSLALMENPMPAPPKDGGATTLENPMPAPPADNR
ncbi:hypothetical protein AAH978_18930 [Streptomyces sp. ZYX-F-203]